MTRRRTYRYDYISQFLSGALGLAIAYIAWATNHLIDNFSKTQQKHAQTIEGNAQKISEATVLIGKIELSNQKDERLLQHLLLGQQEIKERVIKLETTIEKNN